MYRSGECRCSLLLGWFVNSASSGCRLGFGSSNNSSAGCSAEVNCNCTVDMAEVVEAGIPEERVAKTPERSKGVAGNTSNAYPDVPISPGYGHGEETQAAKDAPAAPPAIGVPSSPVLSSKDMASPLALPALPAATSAAAPVAGVGGPSRKITNLQDIVSSLGAADRAVVKRVFAIDTRAGTMVIPDEFKPKLNRWLGSLQDEGSKEEAWSLAETQKVICVTNRWLYETTHFNPLRACRPVVVGAHSSQGAGALEAEIEACKGPKRCDFCDVSHKTAAAEWGRIESTHCITASNAFKSDGAHGILILREHHPLLAVTPECVLDLLHTLRLWFQSTAGHVQARRKAQIEEARTASAVALPFTPPAAATLTRYRSGSMAGSFSAGKDAEPELGPDAQLHPFFLWNCLHKSSATQIHPHGQMMLSPSPPGRVRLLRDAAASYAARFESRDLLEDIVLAHEAVGLVVRTGTAAIVASMTPRVGAGELLVVDMSGPSSAVAPLPEATKDTTWHSPDFDRGVAAAMVATVHGLEVKSFSMTIILPAVGSKTQHRAMARIWSRGDPTNNRADVGAPELMGLAVGLVDPFSMLPHIEAAVRAVDDILGRAVTSAS